MGKVISLRLSDAEEARIRGAAAVAGMSLSSYLKWLLTHGRTGAQSDAEMILRRLDTLGVAIANIGFGAPRERAAPGVGGPPRTAVVSRLKERGVPSSTIRQVEAAWDEAESRSTAAGAARATTTVNIESHA